MVPLNGDKEKLIEHNSAIEANTSSEARTSFEVKVSLSFQRWNVIIITRGIVLQYSISLFVLSPAFSCCSSSPSIRGWQVRPAEFLSDRGTTGSSSSCHRCFLSAESWRTAATNVYAQSLIFRMLRCAIGTGGNGWIVGMADGILARSGTRYQEFGFVK